MMDKGSMSSRDRRALLSGLLVIAALGIFTRGLPAFQEWRREVAQTAVDLTAESEQARRSLALLSTTLDSLELRRDRLAGSATFLLAGESHSAAAATLAARVSAAAAMAQVRLGSIQVHPDTGASGTFANVSVTADGLGNAGGIGRMLAELEIGPPELAIREWSISQADPVRAMSQQETLRFEFTVGGLMVKPNASTRP